MRWIRPVWAAGAAVLALAACGGGGDEMPGTATGTLEELAARAGCTPDIQTDAHEIRQAKCGAKSGGYVLATFATDRGRAEWLDEADDYGGSYLVGRKWVVVGEKALLEKLRGRLGGTVRVSSHHSGNSGGRGNEEDHHSGHHAS
ncbi:hypothetical protein ACFQVC_36670 [Streptomyces monticola]|uniref:Lipoprotein n=1 Tax=Streptomyces monticola TaxID=2666263 RepID=A0ABW2JWQ2_9ACTN